MAADHQFSVTLPPDLAEAVEARVKSGAYESVSAMAGEGMRILLEREAGLERWLRDEVLVGHSQFMAHPSRAVPSDLLLERVKGRRGAKATRGS